MNHPPIQAVVFDMDGVLTDSEPLINAAAVTMFKEKGLTVQPEDFLPFVGTGENRYLGGVAEKYHFPINIEADKKRTYEIYLKLVPTKLEAFPRAQDLVHECVNEGLKIAIASSADRIKIDANLKKIGLPPELWDAIVTGEDVVHKKPAPDIFLAAAAKLNVSPDQCVVLEDAVNGIEAAKAAGMRCVAVAQSFAPDRLRAADLIRGKIGEVTLADLTGRPEDRPHLATAGKKSDPSAKPKAEPSPEPGKAGHVCPSAPPPASSLTHGLPRTASPTLSGGPMASEQGHWEPGTSPEQSSRSSPGRQDDPETQALLEARANDGASREVGAPWGLLATLGFSLVVALAFVGTQLVIGRGFLSWALMANRHGIDRLENNGLYWALATCASSPVVVSLTWLFVRMREGTTVRDYLALRWLPPRQLLRWCVLLLGLVVASDALTSLLDRSIVPDIMMEVHRTSRFLPLLWLALIGAAPLAEEVLFRGFVFAGVAHSALGVIGAVVLSSLAWAVFHLQYDVYGIGTVFVIGLFLGYARFKTNSLYTCIVLHAFMNLIAAAQTLVLVKFIGPGA